MFERGATTGDVYAIRLDAAGQPSGAAFAVAATSAQERTPSVVWNGTNFLVVWAEDSAGAFTIRGSRTSGTAPVLDNPGFSIASGPGTRAAPDVAWNGTNHLVAFEDTRGSDRDIFGARVGTSADVLDPSGFIVDAQGGVQAAPSAAANGSDFFVAWRDDRTNVDADVYGARISNEGALRDTTGIPISTAGGDQGLPAAAATGTNVLVAWDDARASSTEAGVDVLGARVDASGTVLDAAGVVLSTAANAQSSPGVAFDGTNYLVVWADRRSGGSDIYAGRVDAAGQALDGTGVAVTTAANVQSAPSVAWNGTNYLVAWEDLRTGVGRDIYAARVSPAGAVLDPNGIAITSAAGSQVAPSVASDGAGFFVAWEDPRSSSSTGLDVLGARVTGSGSVLDPSSIAIATATGDQTAPSVAWSGASYLTVWQDERSGAADVYGARVDLNARVLDASGIAVSRASRAQRDPAVAWNGTRFLVVWSDGRSGGGTDVYGARVSAEGAVASPPLAIATASGDQTGPSVARDGPNWLAVWEDDGDVEGSRVSDGGSVMDPQGVAVASRSTTESAPSATAGSTRRVAVAYARAALEPPYSAERAFLRSVEDPAGADRAAPKSARVVEPGARFQTAKRFTVEWTAADTGSGVRDYDVRYRRAPYDGGFGSHRTWLDDTKLRSKAFEGAAGNTYCFAVRARDMKGNRSGWSDDRCTAVPVNDRTLDASSAWSRRSADAAYLGTYSLATSKGASLSLAGVEVKRLALVVTVCGACGSVKVFRGSSLVDEVGLEAASTQRREIVVVRTFSSVVEGKIRIVVSSSGKDVQIEGLGISRA